MKDNKIIKAIDDGAVFYLDFFGDAVHMETADNGIYKIIRPKNGEQGVKFIYDIRTEHLSDEEIQSKITEIKSLSLPVWWPLYSERIRSLLFGKDYISQPPTADGEFYMALLPEDQPKSQPDYKDIRSVKTPEEFEIWAELCNNIFSGGYQDVHPENHFRWCKNGMLTPYIAYYENKPAAIAAILDNNGVASFEFVATLPYYRRKGFAKAVSHTAIRNAFANGAKIITLRAFYPANLLYNTLGFQIYY